MLGKLMKYEMKAYSRIILPIFIALMAFAVGIGFATRILPSHGSDNLLFIFAILLYVLLFAAVVFVTMVMVIMRFYNNVLGREGYLMMSLPVRTGTLITSKLTSSVIWVIIGAVVGTLAAFTTTSISLQGTNVFTFGDLGRGLRMLWEQFIVKHPGAAILWVVILIAQICERIVRLYAAAAVGAQWNGHRLIGSILVYVGFNMVEVIILNLLRKFTGMGAFVENADEMSIGLLVVVLAVILVLFAVYYTVAWFFVDRKLNLE